MRSLSELSILLAILGIASHAFADSAPATQPARTGEFEITFTQRSPQSDYAKLVARIGLSKDVLGTDYDLSQEPFVIYVPKNYDPQTPVGLIVQIFQDGSPEIYEPIRPILEDQHFIMIATHKDHRPLLNAVGLCFDAVFNLRQTYNIDPSRVYFMGLGKTEEPIGWSTGDLFMGDVYIWWVGYNRNLNGSPPLFDVNPPVELLRFTKDRPQILGFPIDPSYTKGWESSVANRMRDDGFDHVIVAPVDHDHILEPDWFRQTLQQLESVKSKPPSTHPSEAAASVVDEPTRLFNLAQAYISSGASELARKKLNQLIEKYPNDPAAVKARQLLDQLGGQ